MNTRDLVGKKFNKLTVIEFVEVRSNRAYWKCRCDCGKEVIVMRSNLRKTKSCGCAKTTNRFLDNTPDAVRHAYYNMRKRCNSENNKSYINYGARGISYCEKWSTLDGFLEDMLSSYKPGLSLDRIDVNGMYCKENCRWTTKRVQANNTTANVYHDFDGERVTTAELCRNLNLDYELVRHRLLKGHSLQHAISYKHDKEKITFNGVTKEVGEFAKENGLTYHQLKKRLMRGWTIERALTQPLRKR